MADSDDFVVLPSRVGRPVTTPAPVIVRQLTADDLPTLATSHQSSAGSLTGIAKIRHSHHNIAQLLVKGLRDTEVALITGYTPARIQQLKNDPAFQELLAYYQQEREERFVDVLERMKALGLNSLEELQERLENEPEKWSNREIMELTKLMLVEPQKMQQSPAAGGNAVAQLSVTFVAAKPVELPDTSPRHQPPVIDGTVVDSSLREIDLDDQ